MSSYQQTVVVEFGSSRIKVGLAGESKPRRLFNGTAWETEDCSWNVPINDGVGAHPCNWGNIFQYLSSDDSTNNVPASKFSSAYDWEKALYPLFSHILTSVLFVQRSSRNRILVLTNDIFLPQLFREALVNVVLNYLGIGSLLIVNGGGLACISYLLDGLSLSTTTSSRPKALLLVDVGTFESRVVVWVAGQSVLEGTYQTTMSGYHSFLVQILHNYQYNAQEKVGESTTEAIEPNAESMVTTLMDANAILQAWLSISYAHTDATTLTVNLPSLGTGSSVQLPIKPLQQAFHQVYLDYTNPSSLIYALLTSAMACPIDYKRVVLQNVLLLGGGASALRHFNCSNNEGVTDFGQGLVKSAREACGINDDMTEGSEEKKEEENVGISAIAKQRFTGLKASVASRVNESGERIGGMKISYPDPFAADLATWIGGSIMGTLDLKNEEWLTKNSISLKTKTR